MKNKIKLFGRGAFCLTSAVVFTACGVKDGPSLLGSPSNSGGGGATWSLNIQNDNPNGVGNMEVACSGGVGSVSVIASGNYSLSCPVGDDMEITADLMGDVYFTIFKLNTDNISGWHNSELQSVSPRPLVFDEATAGGKTLHVQVAISG